jgi:hypothetical protein
MVDCTSARTRMPASPARADDALERARRQQLQIDAADGLALGATDAGGPRREARARLGAQPHAVRSEAREGEGAFAIRDGGRHRQRLDLPEVRARREHREVGVGEHRRARDRRALRAGDAARDREAACEREVTEIARAPRP